MSHLEDSSSVVGNQVHTTHLLEHLTRRREVGTMEQALLAIREHSSPRGISTHGQRRLNLMDLIRDSTAVRLQLLQRGQDLPRLINPTSLDQPARRLRQHGNKNHRSQRQHHLEHKREPPRHGAALDKVEAKIDPQGQRHAETDEDTISDDVGASLVCGGNLGLPDWHGGDVAADAEAENESGDDKLDKVERGGHEDGADDGDEVGPEDDLFAAEEVAQVDAGQGPEDTADGVEGNHRSCLDGTY